ncbi:MAG: hypothetical protein C0490_25310 [Marivirga sp.]|nr:hypothetical protein [Marivirga sp.]
MLKTGIFCFTILLLLHSSCSNNKKYRGGLYSVDSLVSAQARYLSENKASLSKTTKLGDRLDKVLVIPKDTIAWKKELEIFGALDIINKPINRALYKSEITSDARSNLSVRSFTTTEELPVKYLKIYYRNTPDKVRLIEARYDESNALFKSARSLTMEFLEVNNKTVLTSYSIIGGQKMFLGDSVQYNIAGALTIKN